MLFSSASRPGERYDRGAFSADPDSLFRDDHSDKETRAVDVSQFARIESVADDGRPLTHEEPTRQVELGPDGHPRSLSDVDWDLD